MKNLFTLVVVGLGLTWVWKQSQGQAAQQPQVIGQVPSFLNPQ